jgi:histidine ammonia-lyase
VIELNGSDLDLRGLERIAVARVDVGLSDSARKDVHVARDFVTRLLERDEAIYGVTTGFGRLAEVVISPEHQGELQRNLIRSHSAGVGPPMPAEEVRGAASHVGAQPTRERS